MSNLLWSAFQAARDKIPRKFFWKKVYDHIAKEQSQAFALMNYGYATSESDDRSGEALPQRLYHYVASAAALDEKSLLEVGSGRGGGLAHVKQSLSPRTAFGVELSPQAVKLARKKFGHVPGLTFLQGDAENLPFGAESFDAVLNVESSHCYPSRERFYREVHRVLVPRGYFLYTDFFSAKEAASCRALLRQTRFQLLEEEDISENVLLALRLDEARKLALIHKAPPWWQGSFQNFAATTTSDTYRLLANKQNFYLRFALQT
jgi:ubiquinone/menaquinone biosynthesis C-methylase UbiE